MKVTLTKMLIALVVLSVVVFALDGDAALAQQATPEQISAETSEDRGPEANLPYLFAAYTVTWVGFFVYVYYLSQRQRSLQREVEALRGGAGGEGWESGGLGHSGSAILYLF